MCCNSVIVFLMQVLLLVWGVGCNSVIECFNVRFCCRYGEWAVTQ